MLKATAQSRAGSAARILIGLFAGLALLDSVGAGAFLAPALLPLLCWAVVTARYTVTRGVLAALAGLCLAVGVSVLLFVMGLRSMPWSWFALGLGVCAFVVLMRWGPRRASR